MKYYSGLLTTHDFGVLYICRTRSALCLTIGVNRWIHFSDAQIIRTTITCFIAFRSVFHLKCFITKSVTVRKGRFNSQTVYSRTCWEAYAREKNTPFDRHCRWCYHKWLLYSFLLDINSFQVKGTRWRYAWIFYLSLNVYFSYLSYHNLNSVLKLESSSRNSYSVWV